MALFKVWLVSVQLLDVHRRYLVLFIAGLNVNSAAVMGQHLSSSVWGSHSQVVATATYEGSEFDSIKGSNGLNGRTSIGPAKAAGETQGYQYPGVIQEVGASNVLGSVQAYYTAMICNAVPVLCTGNSSYSSWISGGSSSTSMASSHHQNTEAMMVVATAGMQEMEYQVVFEILAGLGMSVVMVAVWLWMTALQAGSVVPSFSSSRAPSSLQSRIHQTVRTIQNKAHCWQVFLEETVDLISEQVAKVHHGRAMEKDEKGAIEG